MSTRTLLHTDPQLSAAINSAEHGLFPIFLPLAFPGFQKLLIGLLQTLKPTDDVQRFLVNQIAVCMLRIRNLQLRDLSNYADISGMSSEEQRQPLDDYISSKVTQLARRYESADNRQIEKNLKQLRQMQAEQNCAMETPVDEPNAAAGTPEVSGLDAIFDEFDPLRYACNAPATEPVESATALPLTLPSTPNRQRRRALKQNRRRR